MKHIKKVIYMIVFLFLIAGCTQEKQVACTADAKICPDGSAVGRTGPDCEFEACPLIEKITDFDECVAAGNAVMESFPRQCKSANGITFVEFVEDDEKKYISKNVEECSRIKFMCVADEEPFSDQTGCGCITKKVEDVRVFCTEKQREGDFCIEIFKPVCGYFDPEKIQCVTHPCAETFSNSCFSCLDENVLYYVEGACPAP